MDQIQLFAIGDSSPTAAFSSHPPLACSEPGIDVKLIELLLLDQADRRKDVNDMPNVAKNELKGERQISDGERALSLSDVDNATCQLQPGAVHRAIYCPQLPLERGIWLFTFAREVGMGQPSIDRSVLCDELCKVWPGWAAQSVRMFTMEGALPLDRAGQPNDCLLAFYAVDLDSRLEYGWP